MSRGLIAYLTFKHLTFIARYTYNNAIFVILRILFKEIKKCFDFYVEYNKYPKNYGQTCICLNILSQKISRTKIKILYFSLGLKFSYRQH